MADELSRRIGQRYGLLEEVIAQLFNREYPVEQNISNSNDTWGLKSIKVILALSEGTIGI